LKPRGSLGVIGAEFFVLEIFADLLQPLEIGGVAVFLVPDDQGLFFSPNSSLASSRSVWASPAHPRPGFHPARAAPKQVILKLLLDPLLQPAKGNWRISMDWIIRGVSNCR